MNRIDALEPTRDFTVTRADLVRLRRRERRPEPDPPGRGRRAAGRAARGHRARHVHHGARRPGRRRLDPGAEVRRASAASSPARSSCPPRAASTSRSAATVKAVADGLATVALTSPATGRRFSACPRPSSVPERPPPPTTPRCGSAARRGAGHGHDRGRARRRRRRGRHGRRAAAGRSAAAATWSSPTTGFAARWSRSPPAASSPTSTTTTRLRRRAGHRRRRRVLGRLVAARRRARLGRHRGARRASPGSVGATPIQNVGAYGQEVSQTVASVRVWDRGAHGVRTFANADCGFGYRTSRFKADPGRHVVLDVTFQLGRGTLGAPVAYAELARALGVEPGRAGAAGRRPRGGAGAAPRQGHGARPGRPRHLERRLVLHQPGRRRRATSPTGAGLAAGGRAGSRPARPG